MSFRCIFVMFCFAFFVGCGSSNLGVKQDAESDLHAGSGGSKYSLQRVAVSEDSSEFMIAACVEESSEALKCVSAYADSDHNAVVFSKDGLKSSNVVANNSGSDTSLEEARKAYAKAGVFLFQGAGVSMLGLALGLGLNMQHFRIATVASLSLFSAVAINFLVKQHRYNSLVSQESKSSEPEVLIGSNASMSPRASSLGIEDYQEVLKDRDVRSVSHIVPHLITDLGRSFELQYGEDIALQCLPSPVLSQSEGKCQSLSKDWDL